LQHTVNASLLPRCRNGIVTRPHHFPVCHYLERSEAK
jgi:hypothetical protein